MKTLTLEKLILISQCIDEAAILEIVGDRIEMTLKEILEFEGAKPEYRVWAALKGGFFSKSDLGMIAAAIAESVLHFFESKYPDDTRPRDMIKHTRLCAMGEESSSFSSSAASSAFSSFSLASASASSSAASVSAAFSSFSSYASAAYAAAARCEEWIENLDIIKIYARGQTDE